MPPTIEDYRWRIANIILAGSTLRNQGAAGVSLAAREFVTKLDLRRFVREDEPAFQKELDHQTKRLERQLPAGAQNWGTARKAINLFLAEAQYHRIVCQEYNLERIIQFLEIPLDGQVAEYLREHAVGVEIKDLPSWPGIKHLKPDASKRFQDCALALARKQGPNWARVQMDVIIWRRGE